MSRDDAPASALMASTAFRKSASRPLSSRGSRNSTLRLPRPTAISRPSARSQGAPSSTADAPRARLSKPVASITSTDDPWPRRNLRHDRWIGSPEKPHSGRSDCCTRCSRWSGVMDCATARPGSASSSVRRSPAGRPAPLRSRRATPARAEARSLLLVSRFRWLSEDLARVALATRIRQLVGDAE